MALTRLNTGGNRPLPGLRSVPAVAPRAVAPPAPEETAAEIEPAEVELEPAAAEVELEPAPAAAAPKTPKAPKAPAAKAAPSAPKAPAAPKAAKPPAPLPTLGGERPKLEVELPAAIGGRIAQDSTHELLYRYCLAHEAQLGFKIPTKAMAVRLLMLAHDFLIGDMTQPAPEATAEAIAQSGGLARLFEVKVGEGMHFKHDNLNGRYYHNPRSDGPENQCIRITGRRRLVLQTELQHGQSEYGALVEGEDKTVTFVPAPEAAESESKAA